ncbi:hypothetical protein [Aquipuribacter hungaricus]|uniref:hypothetical protein n=1 Tax=Aquipuribacter hungaricus TaxID=545624 RepID=UPI00361F5E4C
MVSSACQSWKSRPLRDRLGVGKHEVGGLVEFVVGGLPVAVDDVEVVVRVGLALVQLGEELESRNPSHGVRERLDRAGQVEDDHQARGPVR